VKVIYLPKEDNLLLRRNIELEYTREETDLFLQTVTTAFNNPFIYSIVAESLIDVVNGIFIDNLVRFVKEKDSLSIVAGMQNGTLTMMFDIGHRHYIDLIGEELAKFDVGHETEQLVIKALQSYVEHLYIRNKETMDEAILKVFESIYNNTAFVDIRQHRVFFVETLRPAIVMIGEEHASYNANAQCS